jgi:hypothetical protein
VLGGNEKPGVKATPIPVIPAEAGIQQFLNLNCKRTWMPVFTGMTNFRFV